MLSFLNPLRRALTWLSKVSRDRKVLALVGIIAVGAYLRLWNLHHLFNAVHDYDEGVYSLSARFISQGYLPYQDFIFTHPPLHSLTLTSIYQIFGYDFFYGKYLSVVLSLACIVLIYLVGKKMYHPTAGLIAAALFAVDTHMVYFGRRVVQETLGVFLILLAIYFAIGFIQNGKRNRAFFCGLALGLAVATKYLFAPAVIAIIVAIVFLSMGERFWQSIKTLGRPALWVMYLGFGAIFYAFLLLLKWSLKLDISLPFIDPMYWSVENVAVAVLIFLLPLVIAIVMLEKELPFKQWWFGLWALRRNRGLWLLLGGSVLGFIAVTGFFLVKAPQEFIYQTFQLQQGRPFLEFPSLVTVINTAFTAQGFLKMAFLPILLSIPLILVILNKRDFSRSDSFLAVTMLVSLVFCQGFYHLPRYYVPLTLFLPLGLACLMPPLDAKMLTARLETFTARFKAGLLVGLAVLLFSLSLSIVLLTNYTGYDINWPWFATDEEYVYGETINYLEEAGAEKVYAVNPIFPALSPNLDSTLVIDTFALIWLEGKPSEEIIKDRIDEGVDYIVLDSWVKYWGYPYNEQAEELTQAVRRNARLMRVIEPDSPCSTEIYLLGAEKQGIFNGDFAHWVEEKEIEVPLGWAPLRITGEGDVAVISQAQIGGRQCVKLTIYEDGRREEYRERTHAAISQEILFPDGEIRAEIFPQGNTTISGSTVLGPGIHFIDRDGHILIVGFSDEVDGEEVFTYEDGNKVLVVRNAQLHQWSEHTIDLLAYWNKANWQQPQEIQVFIVISTSYNSPGYYALYTAKIEAGDAKAGTSSQ